MAQTAVFASNAVPTAGTLDERVDWALSGVAAANQLDDLGWRFQAIRNLRNCRLEMSDRDGADALTRLLEELVDHLPPMYRWLFTFERAYMALLDGNIQASETLADEALTLGLETGQTDAFQIYGAEYANAREADGRFGELVPMVEESLRETPGLMAYRAVLAQSCVAAGDLDRARDLLTEDRAARFPMGEDSGWINAQLLDRNRGDDHDRARALAESARDASAGRSGWDWIERDTGAVLDALG